MLWSLDCVVCCSIISPECLGVYSSGEDSPISSIRPIVPPYRTLPTNARRLQVPNHVISPHRRGDT